ncbi:hypothetical protein BD309DRAFT_369939 [Dichomitus squalens]|nr:hypothetical protein BD309DRAFT_369939 [Dichomitus squalens]
MKTWLFRTYSKTFVPECHVFVNSLPIASSFHRLFSLLLRAALPGLACSCSAHEPSLLPAIIYCKLGAAPKPTRHVHHDPSHDCLNTGPIVDSPPHVARI